MAYKDKEKQIAYQRKWMAERRKKWFDNNGPCRRCWSNDNLELHHIDPSEKEDHRIWSWSESRRNEELAKCIVLCRDCHKMLTYYEDRIKRQHGTLNMYNGGGCRCSECKNANRISKNEYRARKESIDPMYRRKRPINSAEECLSYKQEAICSNQISATIYPWS